MLVGENVLVKEPTPIGSVRNLKQKEYQAAIKMVR